MPQYTGQPMTCEAEQEPGEASKDVLLTVSQLEEALAKEQAHLQCLQQQKMDLLQQIAGLRTHIREAAAKGFHAEVAHTETLLAQLREQLRPVRDELEELEGIKDADQETSGSLAQLPGFSANTVPAHVRERGRQSPAGAALPDGEGG